MYTPVAPLNSVILKLLDTHRLHRSAGTTPDTGSSRQVALKKQYEVLLDFIFYTYNFIHFTCECEKKSAIPNFLNRFRQSLKEYENMCTFQSF
jgi:hypothetical protein